MSFLLSKKGGNSIHYYAFYQANKVNSYLYLTNINCNEIEQFENKSDVYYFVKIFIRPLFTGIYKKFCCINKMKKHFIII